MRSRASSSIDAIGSFRQDRTFIEADVSDRLWSRAAGQGGAQGRSFPGCEALPKSRRSASIVPGHRLLQGSGLVGGRRTSMIERLLQETDMTAERKKLGQGIAAGTIMGLALGLIIALFTIVRLGAH